MHFYISLPLLTLFPLHRILQVQTLLLLSSKLPPEGPGYMHLHIEDSPDCPFGLEAPQGQDLYHTSIYLSPESRKVSCKKKELCKYIPMIMFMVILMAAMMMMKLS